METKIISGSGTRTQEKFLDLDNNLNKDEKIVRGESSPFKIKFSV